MEHGKNAGPRSPVGSHGAGEAMSVLPFFPRRRSSDSSPLVCFVDLQMEYVAGNRRLALADRDPWASNCRLLMDAARQRRLSIAHFRQLRRETDFNVATEFSGWIDEFRPRPFEMVFERSMPSCYAAEKFDALLRALDDPEYLLVGLTGGGACLSTAVDAFHRGDRCVFIEDASASPGIGGLGEIQSHEVVTDLIRSYCHVITSSQALVWMKGLNQGAAV
jgi:nicotinamidase-related amidase